MTPVIMYSIPICPTCWQAKRFFSQRGIPYEERNIMFNKKYRREFNQLTHVMTVPVTVFGDQVVVGYNAKAFDEAAAAIGY